MDFSFDEAQNITDLVLVPEMPRTSTGKVDRRSLASSVQPTRSRGTHA